MHDIRGGGHNLIGWGHAPSSLTGECMWSSLSGLGLAMKMGQRTVESQSIELVIIQGWFKTAEVQSRYS